MATIDPNVSHYRILEKLGSGGMGVVYRAHDERLDREVAVKVLHIGMLADETLRSRFRREALALSRLNHPNIAVVFDFDNANGMDFLVMEYVAGESLAVRLAAGPLPEEEVIALGTQIAEALEEAHEHDVIHRDLKPGNVMVTAKWRVKVVDFGLAKFVRPQEADASTAGTAETLTGEAIGTIPYMAPEQLQGKTVDARIDLYALGAVLYEMATGRRPYPEKQLPQLVAAILSEAPQPPRELNREVSPGLETIILKALEKNPEQRYQSAKEMLENLDRLSAPKSSVGAQKPMMTRARWAFAAAAGLIAVLAILAGLNVGGVRERVLGRANSPRIDALAVLPLTNLSGDPAQDYLADSMTDELITTLGQISALRVISRTTAMRYKKTDKPLPQIAQELNVDAVLEGSVLRSGERVRIAAKLIQAKGEHQLWAKTYERDLRDMLALQAEIARGVAGGIRTTLTTQEQARLATARRVDPTAQVAYLRGRYFINRWPATDFTNCAEHLEEATGKDPSFAEAHAALAICYTTMGFTLPPGEVFPKAKAAALKALQIDDRLAEAHSALGNVKLFYEWDWAGAERELKLAVGLNPNNALAHLWYGALPMFAGHFDEALGEGRKSVELDPASSMTNHGLTICYLMARRYDEALGQAKAGVEMDPDNLEAKIDVVLAYYLKGWKAQASAEAAKIGLGDHPLAAGPAKRKEALESIERESYPGSTASNRHVDPVYLAWQYAQLGDKERAIKWLEKGYEERSSSMVQLKVNPLLDPLRSDPRFQDLIRRMNFPP